MAKDRQSPGSTEKQSTSSPNAENKDSNESTKLVFKRFPRGNLAEMMAKEIKSRQAGIKNACDALFRDVMVPFANGLQRYPDQYREHQDLQGLINKAKTLNAQITNIRGSVGFDDNELFLNALREDVNRTAKAAIPIQHFYCAVSLKMLVNLNASLQQTPQGGQIAELIEKVKNQVELAQAHGNLVGPSVIRVMEELPDAMRTATNLNNKSGEEEFNDFKDSLKKIEMIINTYNNAQSSAGLFEDAHKMPSRNIDINVNRNRKKVFRQDDVVPVPADKKEEQKPKKSALKTVSVPEDKKEAQDVQEPQESKKRGIGR